MIDLPSQLLQWLLCLMSGAPLSVPATQPARIDGYYFDLGQEVVARVRRNLFDAEHARAWAERHNQYGAEARNGEQFIRLTRAALSELGLSHVAYYTSDDDEHWAMLSIFQPWLRVPVDDFESIGLDLTDDNVVRVVFVGSPAAAAGLRRGDRIILADGQPFHPVRSFRARASFAVNLTIERGPHARRLEITVKPERIDPAVQWLRHQIAAARIIRHGSKRIGYIPIFSGAGEQYEQALAATMQTTVRDADALILDFRYGWGGCSPSFVNLFNPAVPSLTQIERDGSLEELNRTWSKPLFILIGPGTRSGKEVVCYAFQKHKRATLIGQPTAGAVLGAKPFLLRDRSLLILPVVDSRVDGQRLEGNPLKPDVIVEDDLSEGGDPQLQEALDRASNSG